MLDGNPRVTEITLSTFPSNPYCIYVHSYEGLEILVVQDNNPPFIFGSLKECATIT